MILHAREIWSCIDTIRKLNIPRVWFRGYTEAELEIVIPKYIDDTSFDNYIIISDDTMPTQEALEKVEAELEEERIATGWSNIDTTMKKANVSFYPLKGSFPSYISCDYASYDEVMKREVKFRTYFMGFSLSGMRRELWQKFPFRAWHQIVYKNGTFVEVAWGSDYMLSFRLQQYGYPIWCRRDAFVYHLASKENMIVGKVPKKVLIDY